MQDAVFAKVLAKIEPGMRQFEVTALARYEGNLMGSEQGVFMCRSAPAGSAGRGWRAGRISTRVRSAPATICRS